jgi:hypothetical protein
MRIENNFLELEETFFSNFLLVHFISESFVRICCEADLFWDAGGSQWVDPTADPCDPACEVWVMVELEADPQNPHFDLKLRF